VYHVNRNSPGGWGGVAVYVSNNIPTKTLCTSDGESKLPEYVILEISLPQGKLLLASVYRPPKVNSLEPFLNDIYCYLCDY